MRVKCLAQEYNTLPQPVLEPGLPNPESSTLTNRPPRLPPYTDTAVLISLLTLFPAPPRFRVPMMNKTQNVKSQLVVECEAYATPVPDYQWIFNGSVISRQRSLNLSSLKLADQGFYTCFANNSLGSANGRFYLTIQGKTYNVLIYLCIIHNHS